MFVLIHDTSKYFIYYVKIYNVMYTFIIYLNIWVSIKNYHMLKVLVPCSKTRSTRPSTRPCNARQWRTAVISSKSDKKSDSSKNFWFLCFKRLKFDATSQIYSFYAKIDKKIARKRCFMLKKFEAAMKISQ